MGAQAIAWAGAILFGVSSLFSLITLPVEFDASRRAMALLENHGILRGDGELDGAQKVLNAAAWTYIAAAVSAVGSWALYILMSRR